jgi:hypothetical protein
LGGKEPFRLFRRDRPLRCRDNKKAPFRGRLRLAAGLVYLFAWLIVGNEAPLWGAELPVERVSPFVSENVCVDDIAGERKVCVPGHDASRFRFAEISNHGLKLFRFTGSKDYLFRNSPFGVLGAHVPLIEMNQVGLEVMKNCRSFPEVFKLKFQTQNPVYNHGMLEILQIARDVFREDIRKDVSALNNWQGLGSFLSGIGTLPSNIDLFLNSHFVLSAVNASTAAFQFGVLKLALADEIKPDSGKSQTNGGNRKNGSEDRQPFIVARDGLFGTLLWAFCISGALFFWAAS